MIYESARVPLVSLLVVILVFNISQRRHLEHGERKRFASLWAAGLILLLILELYLVDHFALTPWFAIASFLSIGYLLHRLRSKIFIFSVHCRNCGRRLALVQTVYFDDNLCDACRESHETLKRSGEASTQFPEGVPRSVDAIDWPRWRPDERAVLCFIRRGAELLLIEKKTGLGAGKVNAPGGRIEQGESAEDAAVRETIEETGVTPGDLQKLVDLKFVFTNGYSLEGSVFFASSFTGTPVPTPEADPFWCNIDKIPWNRMWEDDAEWLPSALDGKRVDARFLFEGEKMISKEVSTVDY